MFKHRTRIAMATTAILVATLVSVPPALGASPVVPMPGEYVLSDAQRRYAVKAMTAQERERLGHLFEDGAPGQVVAYARRGYSIVTSSNGTQTLEPVGVVDDSFHAFSVPPTSVATQTTSIKPGTDLFHSFVVYKTRSTTPFEWYVENYIEWRGVAGLEVQNSAEDGLASAWAGNLYIDRSSGGGKHAACSFASTTPVNIYQSDGTPNVGLAYSFQEWGGGGWCGAAPTKFAYTSIYIREGSWKNKTDNAMGKYTHTWGTTNISFGFSATGPSISVSGGGTNKWSTNLTIAFAH